MLPKTKTGIVNHKKYKRQLEISLAIQEISKYVSSSLDNKDGNISILEFGSGYGFQIPYLEQIGNVVASDIYTSDEIKKLRDKEFVECSITNTPFNKGQFDLIYSNHVIEHIEDMATASRELKRIGKPSCIYAFSLPTNIWLLLSIPSRYYNKFRYAVGMLSTSLSNSKMNQLEANSKKERRSIRNKRVAKKFSHSILPRGHGVYSNFVECYRKFKIENWQHFFSDNGFLIIKTRPLLLYGPSTWPIIPTTKSKTNVCSSVLSMMRKRSSILA